MRGTVVMPEEGPWRANGVRTEGFCIMESKKYSVVWSQEILGAVVLQMPSTGQQLYDRASVSLLLQ